MGEKDLYSMLNPSLTDKDTNQVVAILNNLHRMYPGVTRMLVGALQGRDDYQEIRKKLEFDL